MLEIKSLKVKVKHKRLTYAIHRNTSEREEEGDFLTESKR